MKQDNTEMAVIGGVGCFAVVWYLALLAALVLAVIWLAGQVL